jgi:arginyl-tRNA synthetase
MSQSFADQLSRLLNEALHETASAADIPSDFVAQIDQAQNRQFGDYQSNAAMILAKQVKKNPRELAAEIIEAIPESNLIETPEIAGPGFINFRITETALDTRLTELLADDTRLGVAKAESLQTIVADFSAPNVAKPMHVGHIRSTIIGDSLTRIGSLSRTQSHFRQPHRRLGHTVWNDPLGMEKPPRRGGDGGKPH